MPITDSTCHIKSLIEQALTNNVTTDQALSALVHVSLDEAIAWLLQEEQAARRSCSKTVLSRVLDSIATSSLPPKGAPLMSSLVTLLRRYSDLIRPDTAAAAIWAMAPEVRGVEIREVISRLLKREPTNHRLLRIASEIAISGGDAAEAHQRLTLLATADESQATVNYAYRMRAKLNSGKGTHVRVALLSSFTADALLPYVDLECRKLGLTPDFYVAPFNSWAQEIIGEDSGLRRFNPEIAFLAVSIDDLIPELAGTPSRSFLDQKGHAVVDNLVEVARAFTVWSDSPLVLHSFYSAYRCPLGILEGRSASGRARWLGELNVLLAAELETIPHAYLLDMTDLLIRRHSGALDNPKMRYIAGMRLGDGVLGDVARAYGSYIAPLKGLRRKCVVVDLDNTLWGGIIGEDGVHGIKLGNTSPGIEYQDFQRLLLALTEQGFLLAINSKNNSEDALEVLRSHEGMILREEVFSAIRINWRPKAENMVSIAEELRIGLDAMIFLDDNPHERELMRQALPEVLTPDLPVDPSLYRQTIERLPQLQSLVITEEDINRVQEYRLKRERDQIRATSRSLEEYLSALDISVQIARVTEAMLPRVHQLFHRTNQFNLTTRRYELGQLANFARDNGWRFYALRVRDRFGDHGLVATTLVRAEPGVWTLDSFLMSCRVIGYGIETALLAKVSEEGRAAGARALVGEFISSKKNSPAADFYFRHGFRKEERVPGMTHWQRELIEGTVAWPLWIKSEETNAT